MDHFGLVESVDRLGERMVATNADAADGRLETNLGVLRRPLYSALHAGNIAPAVGRSLCVYGTRPEGRTALCESRGSSAAYLRAWRYLGGIMEATESKDGPLSSLKELRARVTGQQIEDLEQRKVELQSRLETLSSEISRIDEKLKRLRGGEE
jgi:hypothetical protein